MKFAIAEPLPVYPFLESGLGEKRKTFFLDDESVPRGTIVEINEELAFFMKNIVFFKFRDRYVCCSALEFRRRTRRFLVPADQDFIHSLQD
jgi:hypothetical protein